MLSYLPMTLQRLVDLHVAQAQLLSQRVIAIVPETEGFKISIQTCSPYPKQKGASTSYWVWRSSTSFSRHKKIAFNLLGQSLLSFIQETSWPLDITIFLSHRHYLCFVVSATCCHSLWPVYYTSCLHRVLVPVLAGHRHSGVSGSLSSEGTVGSVLYLHLKYLGLILDMALSKVFLPLNKLSISTFRLCSTGSIWTSISTWGSCAKCCLPSRQFHMPNFTPDHCNLSF